MIKTRAEHVEWCKVRARVYVEMGELTQAFNSITSDLMKHEQTRNHIGVMLGMRLLLAGELNTREKMLEFIEGFN